MSSVVDSIGAEYRRYQALAEGALDQVSDEQLARVMGADGNSLATIVWHVAGNLRSRFTNFLTEDGEKPWRQRDDEFAPRHVSRAVLLQEWRSAWDVLFATLDTLSDADLPRTVTIRQQPLLVHEALHRSLAHVSYHVGQIVLVARAHRGNEWTFLSIPPGGTAAYNAAPHKEAPFRRQ